MINRSKNILPSIRSRNILPSITRKLWEKYFKISLIGECYCCKKEIKKSNFRRGYKINKKNGGKLELENLRPICNECFTNIKELNIDEFMKKYKQKVNYLEIPLQNWVHKEGSKINILQMCRSAILLFKLRFKEG